MLGLTHDINGYLERLGDEAARIDRQSICRLADLAFTAYEQGRFIFVFGNGGSGATASHFAEDLGKNAMKEVDLYDPRKRRPRIMSLADNTSWITAVANDLAFDQVFVQQLMHFGQADDLVIAISGSGNSANVLRAVEWANQSGLITFGLTGFDGGRLRQIQQDGVHVELDDMGIVESLHLALLHWVVEEVHARANRVGRYVRCRMEFLVRIHFDES